MSLDKSILSLCCWCHPFLFCWCHPSSCVCCAGHGCAHAHETPHVLYLTTTYSIIPEPRRSGFIVYYQPCVAASGCLVCLCVCTLVLCLNLVAGASARWKVLLRLFGVLACLGLGCWANFAVTARVLLHAHTPIIIIVVVITRGSGARHAILPANLLRGAACGCHLPGAVHTTYYMPAAGCCISHCFATAACRAALYGRRHCLIMVGHTRGGCCCAPGQSCAEACALVSLGLKK